MEKATHQDISRKRRVPMLVDSYAARCRKCCKWRLFDSPEEYEEIRNKSPNKSFECNNCEEPVVDYPYPWSAVCVLGGPHPWIIKRIKPTIDNNDRNMEKEADTTKPLVSETSSNEAIIEVDTTKPLESATSPNEVIIEEIEKGDLVGRVAVKGKKVSIIYSGKLKDSGKLFISNIGEAPLRFRIGGEKVIKGLSIGVEGMRVGDKRRLTIPPSLGYSEVGLKDVIPKNAWLIYEVEAVKVR